VSKKPKFRFAPDDKKIPRLAVDPTSFHDKRPSWRFSKMEFCDPYGWHVLDAATLQEIREKLKHFETMTWAEILVVAKKQNHTVSVDLLEADAKGRLRASGQGDLEELVSLHLTGKQRIWGILREGVLNLLWWDPDHSVCKAILKHT
jgi:hypothetical protein